jgi:glycosyltransferase involved in cell wall biosynthesis
VTAPPLICLITTGNISTTPRLVKNADALTEAGYRVHVVAGAPNHAATRLDEDILRHGNWEYTHAAYRTGPGAFVRKLARHAARRLVAVQRRPAIGIVTAAHFSGSRFVASVAARIPAHLFLGHCLAALPVAAAAARARNCPYGFDIEDFHDAETEEAIADPIEATIRRVIQSELLPGCRVLTASAPLIAAKYEELYKVRPLVLLNVFPRSHAPQTHANPEGISEERPAVLYWFSQTVGPDRGLEAAIAVMSKMRTPVELHLRGFVSPEYAATLHELSSRGGTPRRVRFLPPASPLEMARLASTADMGLSLERSTPLNRDICLTNKIFVYLLAGIPQLLSNTKGQAALAPQLGDSAILSDLALVEGTARQIDEFLGDPKRSAKARETARGLAWERFCWDVEKRVLLNAIGAVLPLNS